MQHLFGVEDIIENHIARRTTLPHVDVPVCGASGTA